MGSMLVKYSKAVAQFRNNICAKALAQDAYSIELILLFKLPAQGLGN